MTLPKPWKAAAWTPQVASKPIDVKRSTHPTAHAAQQWARKQRRPGRVVQVWHEDRLPPVEVGTTKAQQVVTGRRLKAVGTEVADEGADGWWKLTADRAIDELARRGLPFTADDVRDLGVPDPVSPKAWGPRFLTAARAGRIRRIGYTPSRRASVHAHPIALWQGVAVSRASTGS